MFYLISVNYRYDQALTLGNLNAIFFLYFCIGELQLFDKDSIHET
jgi:hypothetical protein